VRVVVVGVDAAGHPDVVAIKEPPLLRTEMGSRLAELWSTDRLPPVVDVPRRAKDEQVVDRGTGSMWSYGEVEPNTFIPWHRADTLAHIGVISGALTLMLETGETPLGPGDAVVMPGLRHAWRSGHEGCTFTALTISLGAPC
jgi:quercetin dioxygenase-like cupin family protein